MRVRAFRALRIAQLTSMIGTWMQIVGAQWLPGDTPDAVKLVALVGGAPAMPTNARGKAARAGGKAEAAGNSASLELLARVGLIEYGVVHLLVGWLALQIAWRAGE